MNKNFWSKICLSLFFGFSAFIKKASAQLVPMDEYDTGKYELDHFVILATNASALMLRFVGSLALLMFVYGGLVFLLSSGNKEKVEQGKKILMAAVIGLVIVFTSFLIIRFALKSMGINWDGGPL